MAKPTLLIDTIPFKMDPASIEESEVNGQRKLLIRGQFALADVPTANGRYYPLALWEREITRLSEDISCGRLLAELDHPADGQTKLQRVSHRITNLKIRGNEIVGEAEILPTPMGQIMSTLVECGIPVGISSRGYGSTAKDRDGKEVVGEDYRLMTFDVVYNPATSTAYPDVYEESVNTGVSLDLKKQIKKVSQLSNADMKKKLDAGMYESIEKSLSVSNKLFESVEDISTEHTFSQRDIDEAVSSAVRSETSRIKEVYSRRLLEDILAAKDELTENIRNEMLEDPQIASAKTVVESIAKLVRPFIYPGDFEDHIKNLETQVKSKNNTTAQLEYEITDLKNQLRESILFSKNTAIQLRLYKRFDLFENKETLVELMKDKVINSSTVEEVDILADKIASEIGKQKINEAELENVELKKNIPILEAKTNEVEKLKGLLHKASKYIESYDEIKTQHNQLTEQYNTTVDVANKVPELKELLSEASGEIGRLKEVERLLERQIGDLNVRISNLTIELTESRKSCEDSKDLLRDSKNEIQQSNGEISRLGVFEASTKTLTSKIADYNKILSEAKVELESAQSKIRTSEKLKEKSEGKYNKLHEAYDKLKSLASESNENKKEQIRELTEKLNLTASIIGKMQNGKKLIALISEGADQKEIDKIMSESASAKHDSFAQERVRERVRKGFERNVIEDTHGSRLNENINDPLADLMERSEVAPHDYSTFSIGDRS